jgi:hypothetical protein
MFRGQDDISSDPELMIEIADVILLFDIMHEEAIGIKCYDIMHEEAIGIKC